jgi:hypothetical protein
MSDGVLLAAPPFTAPLPGHRQTVGHLDPGEETTEDGPTLRKKPAMPRVRLSANEPLFALWWLMRARERYAPEHATAARHDRDAITDRNVFNATEFKLLHKFDRPVRFGAELVVVAERNCRQRGIWY